MGALFSVNVLLEKPVPLIILFCNVWRLSFGMYDITHASAP